MPVPAAEPRNVSRRPDCPFLENTGLVGIIGSRRPATAQQVWLAWRVDLRRPELTQLILAFILGSQSLSGHWATQQESHDELYEKAREQVDLGDHLVARKVFEQLHRDDPRPEYLFDIAVCEFQLGNYEESYAAFERTVQSRPDSWKFRLGLAKSLYRLDARPEARKEFARVLDQQPQNEEALYYMGLLASAERDYASALAYFKEAIKLYPMNPAALFNAGQMLVRLRDPEQARVYFTRHQQTIEKLNQMYPLKEAARQPGATLGTWTKLGHAYLEVGMQEKALEAFQVARRLGQDPASTGSPGAMPSTFLPAALSDSSSPLRPGDSRDVFNLGQEYREAGRLDDAIEAFRTAHEQEPGNPEPLVAVAEIQMSTRAWKDALETARFLTRRFPALVRGHFLRASCLTQLGRYPGARKWVQRALEIDPAHKPALELLDQINRQLEKQRKDDD